MRLPIQGQRILFAPWKTGSVHPVRWFSRNKGPRRFPIRKEQNLAERRKLGGPDPSEARNSEYVSHEQSRELSLMEQLFPEETRQEEKGRRKAEREIPRLPLDSSNPDSLRHDSRTGDGKRTYAFRQLGKDLGRQEVETRVLVLRNASLNLMEVDFKRLIPQGRHIEGWTLEQGDIVKVIPGRDLATLEQQNYYYLLFSSALSAFTYQGHASKISRLVQTQMPSSVASPIPPPPGYMIEGMDAHFAIESFALLPASQNIDLRRLKPPLAPIMELIVKHKGYPSIVNRRDKMPYEVRLTFDGPQLQVGRIRHILYTSGKAHALCWSGGKEIVPKITKWVPTKTHSPMDHNSLGAKAAVAKTKNQGDEAEPLALDLEKTWHSTQLDSGGNIPHRRTARDVYVLGFYSEGAAQRFVAFWHRRPMESKQKNNEMDEEGDLPPIANVELLW